MAQRRRQTNSVKNGSWGVSDTALKALDSGTYGQLTGRTSKYRTSQEQTRQAQELPVLEGMFTEAKPKTTWESKFGKSGIDTDRARRNYAASHTPIGRGLTKKDADLIASGAMNMLNNNISADDAANNLRLEGITSNYAKNKNWEKEYGKSLETLIKEYADSDEALSRHFSEVGSRGNGLSKTLGSMYMNAFVKPAMGARTIPSNIISPDSEKTNKLNKASGLMSTMAKSAKDSTTSNAGSVGKGTYDFLTNVGERVSRDLVPFGWVLNGLGTAEDVRQELEKEGVSNRKSAGYGLVRGTLDAVASRFAGKLGQNASGSNFATRALKSGLKQGTLGGTEQIIAELADKVILGDEGTYNRDIQNYMARGLSEEEAQDRAWENTLLRIGGMAATRGTIGALTSLGGDAVKGVQNKLKDLAYRAYIDRYVVDPDDPIFNEDIIDIDDLNEYFAPQNALEGESFPRLTGTVDNTQALSGSQYNVPALVDNIYPIQMPGTNGVIPMTGTGAPILLPDLAAQSAPVNTASKIMNESIGWTNPRLVQKLEGEDLVKAQNQVATNNKRTNALKNEIEILKNDKANYYRGNLKKAIQQKIKGIEKEITGLAKSNKDLNLQMKGGLKPVLDMLTTEQKNAIYDTSGKHDSVFSKINFASKFAGDTPESRALAKTAQNAVREYVKTGSKESLDTLRTSLTELDNMAKSVNATWTSNKGNKWDYNSAFGDQAMYLEQLTPVAEIYIAEQQAAKAAAQSAPVETTTPEGIQVYRGYNRSNNPLESNLAKVKSIYDVIGREDPNKPELLPLEYYTDSFDDAQMYANHDKSLYDKLRDSARGELIRAYERGENVPDEEAYIKNAMDESYRVLTGREPIFDSGHVDELTINPKNVLDLSELGETTSVDAIYDYLSKTTGLTPSEIDDALLFSSLEQDEVGNIFDIPTYSVLRNKNQGEGAFGSRFVDFMRNNGYDAVKYKESGANHYALLNDNTRASAPVETPVETPAPTPFDVGTHIKDETAQVPYVTPAPTPLENEPNFSLVGEPYTPQEVPNVQPTPPTTPPPEQEVPNLGGGQEKTSKYYKSTMRNTEANQGMSDEEYAQRYNEELYKYMTRSEQQSVGMAHDFINEAGGNDAAIQRLLSDEFDNEERFNGIYVDAAHILANDLENQAMQMEAQGLDASEQWRLANRLHKKIQENGTIFAQGLQANKKWKKTTSQGALDDLIMDINRGIDSKKTTGYTRNVNKLADKVEDAIASTDNKAEQIARIKDVFAQDRENNPYSTDKAEQLVLNLVGGSKNNKKSVSDLIDEASKLIKKEMGVSSLTPKEERAVLNLLDAASKLEPGTRPYNVLVSRAMVIVDEALPTTIGEKAKSLLYDNMLASIKTMFTRNLGGNLVGNTIDALAAPFQVGADALVGKFTGARTRTLNGKMIVEAAKGFGHGFKDWGQDIGYSLKNKTAFNTPRSGQESLKDVLNAVHKTWKTQSQNKAVKAVTNALSAYDYIIRKGMEGGDRPIYEAQYAATKAELYNVVDKYGDKGLRMGLPADKRDVDTDDLIEAIAINDALEAVLQNDSQMKEAAKNLKAFFKKSSEDMLGIDIASMSHAPFVEVPANMASNFFKLTPIGWAGNIARTIGEKKKYGNINQRRFTGELGLNVLGGLMIGGGMAAAGKYISNALSDDKNERKLQQNNGYQEYALQTPDESTQVDISDIPYLGGMMKFAKMERDAYDENGLGGALLEMPSAASAATVDTLYQALNRLTGADFQYNGSGNLIQNAVNNVKSSVGSMGIPSYIRQTAQYLDPYKRDLGDYGTDEYNKNLIINGIPILREKMLEPKIDTAGQPVPELGGATGFKRFLSAYVSPYKVSHPHENTSEVQEYANMLKQATDGAVNPQMKVINKSDLTKIKGYDAENYSHEDLRKLQEAYYQSNTELGNALINDPWFTNLSYEKQGELLNELWSANKAVNQEKIVREGLTPEEIAEKGDELYTSDNKLASVIRDDDENHTGLLKWLHDETDRDTMNQKYGTEMTHDNYVKYNDREEGYAEQRASETDKAKALDMSVDSYEKYEAEYPGGAQGYYDDKQGAIQYGFVNANKVANVDNYRIAKELGNGDPNVIQAYSDYKQEGIKANAYAAKAQYLADDDRLTDEQKGMIIVGSTDGSKVGSLSKGAQKAYDLGGYAGVNYYYLLKDMADEDGSGTVTKKERENFFNSDVPMLDELWQTSPDLYNYAMANLK